MAEIYQKIADVSNNGREAAVCTIINTKGSTPRKQGAKMLVYESGSIEGTIGGGALESKVIRDALEIIKTRKPSMFSHSLLNEHGMCCGGKVDIYIEPVVKKLNLIIFGAGHIGKSLAKLAKHLDFTITLVDERAEMTDDLGKEGYNLITKNYRRAFPELPFSDTTFIAVTTHDHADDRNIVAYCAKQPRAYLGMIGSKRKVEMAKKTFLAGNILTEEEMATIDWPMGIDIKVQTPQEIAVSILAKLIDVRSKIKVPYA